MSFSKNGKFLVTAGRDNKPQLKSRFGRAENFLSLDKTHDVVKVWNTPEWSLSRTLPKATSRVVALSFTPSGQLLASGEEDGEIAIMNTKTWRTTKRLKFQHGSLKTLAFDASGTRLIGIGYRQGLTRKYWQSLTVWATSDWTVVTAFENQTSPIRAIDYNPSENQLATRSRDDTVTLLSLSNDGEKILEMVQKIEPDKRINVMRFSPDGRTLVFGDDNGIIKVLGHLTPIPMPRPTILVTPLTFIPIPLVTSSFNNSESFPVIAVLIFGLIAFLWFRHVFARSRHKEENRALPASSSHKPLPADQSHVYVLKAGSHHQKEHKDEEESGGKEERLLPMNLGCVYLLKAGPYYKIGKSKDFDRRIKQIKLQLPYPVEHVHKVMTEDMTKLESMWHRRFKEKRANGEWFLLSDADIEEFMRQPSLSRFH